jgi:hypothetical protein
MTELQLGQRKVMGTDHGPFLHGQHGAEVEDSGAARPKELNTILRDWTGKS